MYLAFSFVGDPALSFIDKTIFAQAGTPTKAGHFLDGSSVRVRCMYCYNHVPMADSPRRTWAIQIQLIQIYFVFNFTNSTSPQIISTAANAKTTP